jgi:hypothetical protein
VETEMPSADSWFGNKNSSTGAQLLQYVPRYAIVATLIFGTGTGAFADDRINLFRNQQSDVSISRPFQAYGYARTPAEDIERIRKIFNPAVSDLAKAFNVSRQSIYNWLGGDQPSPIHLGRLRDFALAADVLAETTTYMKGTLLRRKTINGKSLIEIVQNGGRVQEAAQLLRNIVQQETRQREELSLRFAGRRTNVRSADSDLIAENDPV